MQRDKRKVESSLRSKGFQPDERHHHYFLFWTADGKRTTVKTRTSHGTGHTKSVGDPLLGQMAKQCGLEKLQFLDLIDCPLGQPQYEALLREKGLL